MEVLNGIHVTTTSTAQAIGCVALALQRSRPMPRAIADVECALQAVSSPEFASDDSALARNRLLKAQRYLQCGERGAAEFELSLVLRSLKAGKV